MGTYRPRSRLARTLQQKCISDDYLRNFDKNKWYSVESQYLPHCLQSSFKQLTLDAETQQFLETSEEKSSWLFTQLWHMIVKTLLGFFITQTSINGLLRRGSMFVFSREQFITMTTLDDPLMCSPDPNITTQRNLLDLGAGDGAVTAVVAHLYDHVYATEISPTMKRILSQRNYVTLDINTWTDCGVSFDTVLCLNLLDRCDAPLDMLADVKKVLKPNGLLVLALVLPFKPYVETGRPDHMPSQNMCISGERFEDQVNSFVHNVLTSAGYSVVRWSRIPYLCEGDLAQAYYWLDDVLFVLKATT